ncbi:eukaryotic translation initiation factor 4G-like isoform X2 [Diospyros lotus]|uniref:eukaryotic translation initiation factor 4G-like isoform X2 n=1 Tax=Diospyros lotus TaxID=55363 RepID=UPI0022585390|nr:eukaryotic translation initiation factor 4G-like isoform X2 [Diospyros lotus]
MSLNQSRAERSDSSQYRPSGRSGSSAQPRNLSSGSRKGGGTAPPPSSSSVNSTLTSNRSVSLKKSNNAQGGQSRVGAVSGNLDAHNASAARTLQNGSQLQPPVQADAPEPAKPTTDTATQRSTQPIPNVPSSQTAANTSDTTPATPAKGDASRPFALQFGSISPGLVQIPARTNSAPPNLDEQKRDQARHSSSRAVSTFPVPAAPKHQMPRRDGGAGEQSGSGEAHQISKPRRDVQVSAAPPVTQTQKGPFLSMPGVSMPMPFHQPQIPVQFGGPNPQIQSQGVTAASMPVPMPVPLPMRNPPPLQQQVFVPALPPHPMQPQGMMHQNQGLNFTPQMGPQLPSQLGNLGISMSSQFTQQQTGKLGPSRKPVKITHPDTHEELRLDRRADTFVDSGSSGPRTHPNVPQSQSSTSVPPHHPVSYYPNSLYFTRPSSVPLTSSQIHPSPQVPRFSYAVSQGPQSVSFMNPSGHISYSNKSSAPVHNSAEQSSLERSLDVHSAISSVTSASVQVTIKPAAGSHVDKIAESSHGISSHSVEKGESPKFLQKHGETISVHLQKDLDNSVESAHQPDPDSKQTSSVLPVSNKQTSAATPSAEVHTVTDSLASSPPVSLENSTSVTQSSEGRRRETFGRSDSVNYQEKKQIKEEHSQPQEQVSGGVTSISRLPSQSVESSAAYNSVTTMPIDAMTTTALSSTSGDIVESTGESLTGHSAATPDADSDRKGSICEFKTVGTVVTVDTNSDHHPRKNDPSQQDECLKSEIMGTNEQELMLTEGCKHEKNSSEIYSVSVSLKSLETVNHMEGESIVNIASNSNEVGPPEIAQKTLEEPVDCCRKDDLMADKLDISTPLVPDATNLKFSSSSTNLSTSPDIKPSASDQSLYGSDNFGSREGVSMPPLKHEGKGSEDIHTDFVSLPSAGSKDKPVPELSSSKSNGSRGKKKWKETLQKADAAGTTSDLYMAYKASEGKKEIVASSEVMASASSINSKQVQSDPQVDVALSEKCGLGKAEPDDWEDAADMSTSKLETVDDEKQVHVELEHYEVDQNGATAKKYSRDFLLKFSSQCTDLPEGFEIASDIAEALVGSNVNASRESFPSPGRIIDRQSGGSRPDRRGIGMGEDDKWSKSSGPIVSGRDPRIEGFGGNFRPGQGGNYGVLRNPRAQAPAPYAGGILSGPMHSLSTQGGMQRNSLDSDRWQRASGFQKGLIPSPQTPLQVMHRAEKKYEVGKVSDEEEAKQRQLKGILNKLTPQNFEKLFEQVKAVNIDNVVTLTGVISQIFDKALMEPTFCEMYANFCYQLAGVLPDFSENNEKVTFKRLLLNKCQEEFERGEREQEEADRADQEGEVKQSEEEREEKRIRARRRMLGNIRLIGELYKKKMLTERIMHECIKKLLGQYQNPDEEDIEALCKLMSTIGEIIDHPKAKEHMDFYFDMMAKLSNNMRLSSRVRFMLKDSIDLRKNSWQQRRKVEGPKKIEEVHRDAAQERHMQAGRLARGPGINSSGRNRQPVDFAPRGSSTISSSNAQVGSFRGLATQLRGFGTQDFRTEDRHSFENRTLSVPLPQRPINEDSITLGPQGGLARGMSIRGQPSTPNIPLTDVPSPADARRTTTGLNGYSSGSERTAYGREDPVPRFIPDRFVGSSSEQSSVQDRHFNHGNRDPRNGDRLVDKPLPIPPTVHGQGPNVTQNASPDKVWSEDRLRDMSIEAIKEFYSAKDEKEVALCVKDLNAPSFYSAMVSIWVIDSFERKDKDRDLLAKLLVNLSESRDGMLNQDHLMKGFEFVLNTLEDAVNDAPRAGEFLGRILAKVILENVIPFPEIGQLIYEGGEEQGRLVEIGLAAEVVGTILETIKSDKGESAVSEIRTSSSLKLEKFRPPDAKKSWRLDKFI